MTGVQLPICSADRLRETNPTTCCSWRNHKYEITRQLEDRRQRSGTFIVHVPQPDIV
jgi:hypothetical protein